MENLFIPWIHIMKCLTEYWLATSNWILLILSLIYFSILFKFRSIARNIAVLKSLDVRHVLNAAFGSDVSLNLVDISAEIYWKNQISFLGIESIDLTTFDLFQYFQESADFIELSLKQRGNQLAICHNCQYSFSGYSL